MGRSFRLYTDIKPANVLIQRNTLTAKLCDLGLSKFKHQTNSRSTGGMKGTPSYLAPESVTDGTYDTKTDIFALGVTIFELFSETEFWNADYEVEQIKDRLRLGDIPNDLSLIEEPTIQTIVAECISAKSESRPTALRLITRIDSM